MTRFILGLCVASLALISCQKDEIPVAPHDRGPVKTAQVELGTGYHNQVYYSLEQHTNSGSNLLTEWDIAFEGGSNGWKVILNDSRMMAAWESSYTQLADASDTSGFGHGKRNEICATRYTDPAMGDWRNENPVYLIDLGYGLNGLPMGLYWVQIMDVDEDSYTFRFRAYGDNQPTEASINRSTSTAYQRYSLIEKQEIATPEDSEWEIQFSKYAYRFIDPPQDYLVTGVLINPSRVVTAEVFDKSFEEISAADTAGIAWTGRPDAIGYDWKYYDFDSGTYEIDATRTWLIRTREGYCYKLRFADYYDEQGNAGVPQFEFGEL